MALLTPNPDEKLRALRRMKLIATGAFVAMTVLFIISARFGNETLVWLIRWDHVNAFAEASMVGALADWFAVVALFRHPLGIPIWHTAIIPRKKTEIGRNLGSFVETRLLSMENVTRELERFSVSRTLLRYLDAPDHRKRVAGWAIDALGAMTRAADDETVERMLADAITGRLKQMNAAGLLGKGVDMLVASKRHQELIDNTLHQIAAWVPSHRDTIREFIERAAERTLRWGSHLIPNAVINRATEQTLTALIEVLEAAANDPAHPLRADLDARVVEWADRLKNDPEWIERINAWKDEAVNDPRVRGAIAGVWESAKEWIVDAVDNPDSPLHVYALAAVDSLHRRLRDDTEFQRVVDERAQSWALMLLGSNHHAIGALIQRIVDAWDADQLSRELELNLGRDLQYIRLNGTIIGGLVGLVIHLLR